MKIYSLLLFLALPFFLMAQDPDVGGGSMYSDIDSSTTPFSRNEKVCFNLQLGAAGADLTFPPPGMSPFEVNVSTTNLENRMVNFLISADPFLDEDFFTVTIPVPGQINFTQNQTIPVENYSIYEVCGIIPPSATDGSTVGYQANGNPGGYNSTNQGTDAPSNFGTVQGILPIELLYFEATPDESRVDLHWQTATEINNSHFDIERSGDGQIYTKIGEVNGHGTTSQVIDYEYTDNDPLPGRSYYRLNQIDFGGAHSYSHVEEVSMEGDGYLKIFPNPVPPGSDIHIQGTKIRSVKIFNMLGQLIIHEVYDRPQTNVAISSSNLPQGTYVTRVNDVHKKRVVIR